MRRVKRLADDDRGFIVTLELILISTIVVIGLVTALATVRDALVAELTDVAQAIQQISQSYRELGVAGQDASVRGAEFGDHTDAPIASPNGAMRDTCIAVYGVADE